MSDSKELTVTQLLDKIGDAYKSDPSRASLVLSSLGGGQYYASVVRYTQAYGEGKQVVCSAKGSSVRNAMVMVLEKLSLVSP